MDHYLKRGPDGIYGKQALKLILKVIVNDSKVIFSNFNEKEMKEAYRLAKQREVPLGDAIHAVLSRDHEATLVSRDEKDFSKLKDVTPFREPKDLI